MNDDTARLGPIRPEHATDGWRLEGDEGGWWLSKRIGAVEAKIRATTPRTLSWRIDAGGEFMREASAADVYHAKTMVDDWVEEYGR